MQHFIRNPFPVVGTWEALKAVLSCLFIYRSFTHRQRGKRSSERAAAHRRTSTCWEHTSFINKTPITPTNQHQRKSLKPLKMWPATKTDTLRGGWHADGSKGDWPSLGLNTVLLRGKREPCPVRLRCRSSRFYHVLPPTYLLFHVLFFPTACQNVHSMNLCWRYRWDTGFNFLFNLFFFSAGNELSVTQSSSRKCS